MTVVLETSAAAGAAASETHPDETTRSVSRMTWRLASVEESPSPRSLEGRRILVIGGEENVADRVRTVLKERRAHLITEPWANTGGEWRAPDVIVDLTLAEPFALEGQRQWRPALLRTFETLRRCYDDWSEEAAAHRLTYLAVTYLGGRMGYHPDDVIDQPLGGLWAGFAKTLNREIPNCRTRILDVAFTDVGALPELVTAELTAPGPSEIAHYGGCRWTLAPEPESAGSAAVHWSEDDTLLITGGGRGIGMALARRMARTFGVHVVVTGRSTVPPEGSWPQFTPSSLEKHRLALWSEHGHGRSVPDIRRAIANAESTWELVENLRSARLEGLRIDYTRCDFTDSEQVADLVRRMPGLTAVVHNAGVDRPVRLPRKSDSDIINVVATKVDSFINIFRAVRSRKLKLFCTVGSLSGRLGGMVGQLDYAAANECLARLGLWAERQVAFPVMTLAWPTWEKLGLITNYEASLRYMAAMGIADGLDHWQAELQAGTRGEIGYVAPLGTALHPLQAADFPMASRLPGASVFHPKLFHLGVLETYRPLERMTGIVEFDPAMTPAVGDFTVGGTPAVPVSLLLESALRGAEWIVPEEVPRQSQLALDNVSIPWAMLRCGTDGRVRLRRYVRARKQDGQWIVDVTFSPVEAAVARAGKAHLRISFDERSADGRLQVKPFTGNAEPAITLFTGRPILRWHGLAMPLATWRRMGNDRIIADVAPCNPGDVWAVPAPPACAAPFAVIENMVRAIAEHVPGLHTTTDPLVIKRIKIKRRNAARVRVTVDLPLKIWRAYEMDPDGLTVMMSGFVGDRS